MVAFHDSILTLLLGGCVLGLLALRWYLKRQAARWDQGWLERELHRRGIDASTFCQGTLTHAGRLALRAKLTKVLFLGLLGLLLLIGGLWLWGKVSLRTGWLYFNLFNLTFASGLAYFTFRFLARWFQTRADRIRELSQEPLAGDPQHGL